MTKNRLIYICVLIGTLLFYFFYKKWLAWICVMLVILFPVLSLVALILSTKRLTVKIHTPAETYHKMITELKIVGKPFLILISSAYIMDFKITDIMTGEVITKKYLGHGQIDIPINVNTEHCGAFYYEVEKLKIYDLFGLFYVTPYKNRKTEILVKPVSIRPDRLPDFESARSSKTVKSNSLESEIYDIREFAQGDLLKSIHWKASAKRDMLLVREAQEEVHENACFPLDLCTNRDELDKRLGNMRFVSEFYLENGIPHIVIVKRAGLHNEVIDIKISHDLELATKKILHMELPKEVAL